MQARQQVAQTSPAGPSVESLRTIRAL